ncbi:hypothetical protein OkiPb01551_28130 [Bordetella pertussis]
MEGCAAAWPLGGVSGRGRYDRPTTGLTLLLNMCGSSVVGAAMAGCGAGDSQPAGCHVGNRGLSGVLRVPRGAEKSVLVRPLSPMAGSVCLIWAGRRGGQHT